MSDIKSSYHVRGLVRELGEEINAVRRELLNLQDAGILKSAKDGNKLVYRIDRECPIIWELRSMFFKESDLGKLILNTLKAVEGIDMGLITESFLKNKYNTPEDIDMLILGDIKVRELTSAITQLEKTLNREIKFAVLKKDDYEFGRKKQDKLIMNILEKDKIIIIGKNTDLL